MALDRFVPASVASDRSAPVRSTSRRSLADRSSPFRLAPRRSAWAGVRSLAAILTAFALATSSAGGSLTHARKARTSPRSHRNSTVSADSGRRASSTGWSSVVAMRRATSHSMTEAWMNPNMPSSVRTSRLPEPMRKAACAAVSRPSARPVSVSPISVSSSRASSASPDSHSRTASAVTTCHSSSRLRPAGEPGTLARRSSKASHEVRISSYSRAGLMVWRASATVRRRSASRSAMKLSMRGFWASASRSWISPISDMRAPASSPPPNRLAR
ncbi:hypothetical protein GCM10020220_014380 [Nonomuraea rubra]